MFSSRAEGKCNYICDQFAQLGAQPPDRNIYLRFKSPGSWGTIQEVRFSKHLLSVRACLSLENKTQQQHTINFGFYELKMRPLLLQTRRFFWGITENKKIQIRHGCHWPCTNKACPAGTEVVEGRHSWKSKLWPPGQVNSLRHFLFYAREVQFWGPWAF